MKAPSLIIILFLLCMTIGLVALGLVSVHNQRNTSQAMERVIASLTERANELEAELKTLREAQASRDAETRALASSNSVPVALTATNRPAADADARPPMPQPFQARAYVGKDFLGTAWVVPSNLKENPETGEYLFEPVIWIDEKARKTFTQTNVVEREVVRNNSYTQIYQQPYWYSYPVWVRPDRPNHPHRPPPERPRPQLPAPGRPGGQFSTPMIGNGDRSTPMMP